MAKAIRIIIVLLVLLSVSAVAEESFIFKQSRDTELILPVYQSDMSLANNNTNCTITIKNPKSELIADEQPMSRLSTGSYQYNISGENTSLNGLYPSLIRCEHSSEVGLSTFNLLITPSGTNPSFTQGILYSVLLFLLFGLFSASIFGAIKIDGKNEFHLGAIISVNFNKYYKLGLGFAAYLFLVFISYLAWAISLQFLFLGFASSMFDVINEILWIMLAPIMLIFITVGLIKFVADMRLEKLGERNLKPRKSGKKGW